MTTNPQPVRWYRLLLPILLCLCLATLSFLRKTGWDVEEVWSYTIANSSDTAAFFPHTPKDRIDFEMRNCTFDQYFYNWHDGSFYQDAITVQPDETFSYGNVLRNAAADEHPPLYFFLLHTVCSCFPDSFSGWYAFSLNLVFYAASLFLLYRIARALLLPHDLAVLGMLCWGLSQAGIDTVVHLRLYMLLTCLTLLVTCLHLRLFQRFRWQALPLLFLAELAGLLTHHYFLIYTFCLTAACSLFFLRRKQTGKAAALPVLLLFAVGTALCLFPAAIDQIITAVDAKSIDRNLLTFRYNFTLCSDVLEQAMRLYTGIPLPPLALYLLLLLGSVLAVVLYIRRLRKTGRMQRFSDIRLRPALTTIAVRLQEIFPPAYRLVLIALLLSGTLINLLTEHIDGLYVRYLLPLMPLFALPLVSLLGCLPARWRERLQGKAMPALVLCLALCSHLPRNAFLTPVGSNSDDPASLVAGQNLVLVNHQAVADHAFAPLCRLAAAVYPAEELHMDLAEALDSYASDTPLLLILDSSAGTLEEQTAFLTAHAPAPCTYLTELYFPLNVDRGYYVFRME